MISDSIITLNRNGKTIVIYIDDWNSVPSNLDWIKDIEVYEGKEELQNK